jgi:hypothetical protein
MSRLLTMAKKGVREIRDNMTKPDQNWLPTLMYVKSSGAFDVVGIALEPESVTPDDITAAAEFVTQRLRENHAVEAVFVATVWLQARDKEPVEGVMVAHVDQDHTEVQVARIKRTAGKPKLAEWQHVASDIQVPPMVVIDAMRAAL